MFNRCSWLGLLLILLGITAPALAQSSTGATLFPPDTQTFPRVQTYLDVYDSTGNFVHGLGSEDVDVRENGSLVSLLEFEELRPGAQVVYVINPGETFTTRNSRGLSRYDFIVNTLTDWASARQGSSVDDLSLLVTNGPVRTHLSDPVELTSTLQDFQMDTNSLSPSLDILLQALDAASDPSPRPGMERIILFITSPLPGDPSAGLQDIIIRAQQQGTRIYVWVVAFPEALELPGIQLLVDLAESTGGEYFAYTGDETIPSPEAYLSNVRDIYHLAYESRITTEGPRQLQADIQVGDEVITAPAVNFDLSLLPPDLAFIMPAVEITRNLPASLESSLWRQAGLDELVPREQTLPILIDFPDGRIRPLQWTRLYIDGELAAENAEPPFDEFVWDLSAYTTSSQHVLRIEALDSLGMLGKSIETPVDVRVQIPGIKPLAYVVQNGPVMLALAVLLAGALVGLFLILGGKIGPRILRAPAVTRFSRSGRTKNVIEPNPAAGESRLRAEATGRRLSGWVNRLHWPQRRLSPQAYAYLVYISEAEETTPVTPISISSDEITFGRDKSLAMLVLEDASVDMLHSRMKRNPDGSYRLVDEGSIAGTWVNYTQVGQEGITLEHGDLIHIGRVGFRYKLRDLRRVRKPVIHPEEKAP